ncbi:hypothetical protein GALMADRAFT_94412 [Galerina marginata CBS 339.88]|uniref:F-box domain-containing protein n=1 Tax=Galerina marginata (strain CBS 339.88) TaxID=685588 RepID=A0A067TDF3_GALM3|nr:hypothetical protein GALMADRAFT_94412 [Galerina marginata CBS 339.88]
MFLDLPAEIIVQILHELVTQDLFACQLTSRYLHNIVKESVVLQYGATLAFANAEDNPCSNHPVAEKLRALKSGEKAWSFLRPVFTKSVPVTHGQSGIYDLSAGVYLLSNSSRTALHYLRLPSNEDEDTSWQKIHSEKVLIDIGLCLYEHDLIVIVTKTPHREHVDSSIIYNIELDLVQFSTGKSHPQARESRIRVISTESENASVGIEIVGDNLILILSFPGMRQQDDCIFIYEWKTGVLKTSFLAPYRTYSGPIFLTEHLIVIPNTRTMALDFFHIPSKPTVVSPTPVLILGLPALADSRFLGAMACRAEPNPIGARSYLRKHNEQGDADPENEETGSEPRRAFLARAEDAICIFELHILVLHVLMQGGWPHMQIQFRHHFTFVVHRKSLAALVEKYGRKEDDTGDLDIAHPGTLPGSTVPLDSSAPTIPWAEWGPPITRWFNSDDISSHWITSTAGQRYVRMEGNPPESGVPIHVMDFNPHNIRKMKKYLSGEYSEEDDSDEDEKGPKVDINNGTLVEREESSEMPHFQQGSSTTMAEPPVALQPLPYSVVPPTPSPTAPFNFSALAENGGHVGIDAAGSAWEMDLGAEYEEDFEDWGPGTGARNRFWCVSDMEQVQPADVFAEPVAGALPYVACASEERYTFDGVLLDEERVIGLRTNDVDNGNIQVVEILHFG